MVGGSFLLVSIETLSERRSNLLAGRHCVFVFCRLSFQISRAILLFLVSLSTTAKCLIIVIAIVQSLKPSPERDLPTKVCEILNEDRAVT